MTWGYGKVILLGEHAVVYGQPALAGALTRGVQCLAQPSQTEACSLYIPAWEIRCGLEQNAQGQWVPKPASADAHQIASALAILVNEFQVTAPITIQANVNLPSRAGLGSSAALTAALARCLSPWSTKDPTLEILETAANHAESVFHDNPSGVDVALALRGGLGVFRRQTGFTPLDIAPLTVAVGIVNQTRSTSDMVSHLRATIDNDPASMKHIERLGAFASRGIDALQSADMVTLGALMTATHQILAALGVSTEELEKLVKAATQVGAHGAKLTGAGGGGSVIALCDSDTETADAICASWRKLGAEAFITQVGIQRKESM